MSFETAETKIATVRRVGNVFGTIRTIYTMSVQLQEALALYQSNTDPAFNAVFNTLFSAAERAELAAMITQQSALAADWQANHAGVLNA